MPRGTPKPILVGGTKGGSLAAVAAILRRSMSAMDFPETIPALLERGRTELLFESDRWSPADLLAAAGAAALGLAERGVGRGARGAILGGNRPELLFAWFAATLLGAIAVPVNPAYKPPELARLFAHCAPRLAVVADDLRPLAAGTEGAPPLVAPAELAAARGAAPPAAAGPD